VALRYDGEMTDGDDSTVDEALLDALALEAADHLRRRGAPLPVAAVVEELQRRGAHREDAIAAVEHGILSGALVMLGEQMLEAGIVRGWI
jgi:hypothetical protein